MLGRVPVPLTLEGVFLLQLGRELLQLFVLLSILLFLWHALARLTAVLHVALASLGRDERLLLRMGTAPCIQLVLRVAELGLALGRVVATQLLSVPAAFVLLRLLRRFAVLRFLIVTRASALQVLLGFGVGLAEVGLEGALCGFPLGLLLLGHSVAVGTLLLPLLGNLVEIEEDILIASLARRVGQVNAQPLVRLEGASSLQGRGLHLMSVGAAVAIAENALVRLIAIDLRAKSALLWQLPGKATRSIEQMMLQPLFLLIGAADREVLVLRAGLRRLPFEPAPRSRH